MKYKKITRKTINDHMLDNLMTFSKQIYETWKQKCMGLDAKTTKIYYHQVCYFVDGSQQSIDWFAIIES